MVSRVEPLCPRLSRVLSRVKLRLSVPLLLPLLVLLLVLVLAFSFKSRLSPVWLGLGFGLTI